MSDPRALTEEFVDAICELAKVNVWTGIWDNRRFQECKKPFEEVDCQYLYRTEKLSRKNVELRAVYRDRLDSIFDELIRLRELTDGDGRAGVS